MSKDKPTFFQKLKNMVGLGPKKCICRFENGKYYCYKWDSGKLVQCIGAGPFNTLEECEQVSCNG
jgi:hypothetical protein